MKNEEIYEEILCAGFGGQGIMLLGKLLAYAGMIENRHVTYIPSYGAEVRGGTAYCNVIVSSHEIASPIVSSASIAIIMNQPSFLKYENAVMPDGLLFLNSTLVLSKSERKDIEIINIPATQMADEIGAIQCANMIVLGCLIARKGLVKKESVIEGLKKALSPKKQKLLAVNIEALRIGREFFETSRQRHGAVKS